MVRVEAYGFTLFRYEVTAFTQRTVPPVKLMVKLWVVFCPLASWTMRVTVEKNPSAGAVQETSLCEALVTGVANVPALALQVKARASPSGSWAVTLRFTVPPTAMV